jgi:hypothetical protein
MPPTSGVGVHDGVVTLIGFVASYAEKLAAERAVRRVKGVRAIAQDIEIRLPSDKKTADDEIAKRAVGEAAHAHHVDVDSAPVSMEMVAGWQACPLLLDQRDAGATSRLVPGGPGAALRAVGNSRHPAPGRRAHLLR